MANRIDVMALSIINNTHMNRIERTSPDNNSLSFLLVRHFLFGFVYKIMYTYIHRRV